MIYLEEAYLMGEIIVSESFVKGYYEGDEHWPAGNYEYIDLDAPFCQIFYSEESFHIKEGYEKGVRSIPTFFIDGEMIVGARQFAYFEPIVDENLGIE